MRLELRLSRTATGKPELIAGAQCEWQEFPGRAQAIVDRLRMTIVTKIDGPDEQMWIASIGNAQFCISWDTWLQEVSIMAWENTPDAEIERLAANDWVKLVDK
jgi:hypothetical protein